MFHFAICDDESVFAEHTQGLLQSIIQKQLGQTVSMRIDRFADGMDLIARYNAGVRFDMVFLDVMMETIDGLSAAAVIRAKDKQVPIVFISSYENYAIKGYEVQACRYLVKPVQEEQLLPLVEMLLSRKKSEKWFFIKEGSSIKRIAVNELLYLAAADRKTSIHTKKDSYISSEKLSDILQQLSLKQFVQCHQSYAVNLNHVFEIRRYEIVLSNKQVIPASRAHWEKVKAAFLKAMI